MEFTARQSDSESVRGVAQHFTMDQLKHSGDGVKMMRRTGFFISYAEPPCHCVALFPIAGCVCHVGGDNDRFKGIQSNKNCVKGLSHVRTRSQEC